MKQPSALEKNEVPLHTTTQMNLVKIPVQKIQILYSAHSRKSRVIEMEGLEERDK